MNLTKMMLLVLTGILFITGCTFKLLPTEGMSQDEVTRLLNESTEAPRNHRPQIIPVRTTPSGATVLVDGAEQGQTPFDLKLKRGAYEYKIEIIKDGYRQEEIVLAGKVFKQVPRAFANKMNTHWFYVYQPEGINVTLTKK